MDAIKRDIYVLRDTIQYRIEVTRGTNMIPIELTIRDFNIPTTATAVAYAFSSRNDEPSKMMCDIVEKTIKFTPSGVFFETGLNQLMIRIINDGKRLISFEVPVWCKDNKIRESDKSEEDQQTLIEQLLEKNGNLTDQVDKERKRIDNLVAPGKSAIGLAKKQLTKDANKLSQTEGSHTHSTSWTSTGSDDDATFLASVKDKNVFVLDCFCRTHSSKTNTWGNTYHEAEAAITINGDTVSVNATYKTTDTNTDAAIFTVVLGYDEDNREIADLRVDSDGVTHNSAGAAVRAQTKDVPAMRDCLQSPYVDVDLLELGNINKSTGAEEDSTKILRSERFKWNKGGKITAPSGYVITTANYTLQTHIGDNGAYTREVYQSTGGYANGMSHPQADSDKDVRRLLIKRSDGADINVEDLRGKITTNVPDLRAMDVLDKMQEEIENVQVDTDTTLTKEGAPADAAETGRRIAQVEEELDNQKFKQTMPAKTVTGNKIVLEDVVVGSAMKISATSDYYIGGKNIALIKDVTNDKITVNGNYIKLNSDSINLYTALRETLKLDSKSDVYLSVKKQSGACAMQLSLAKNAYGGKIGSGINIEANVYSEYVETKGFDNSATNCYVYSTSNKNASILYQIELNNPSEIDGQTEEVAEYKTADITEYFPTNSKVCIQSIDGSDISVTYIPFYVENIVEPTKRKIRRNHIYKKQIDSTLEFKNGSNGFSAFEGDKLFISALSTEKRTDSDKKAYIDDTFYTYSTEFEQGAIYPDSLFVKKKYSRGSGSFVEFYYYGKELSILCTKNAEYYFLVDDVVYSEHMQLSKDYSNLFATVTLSFDVMEKRKITVYCGKWCGVYINCGTDYLEKCTDSLSKPLICFDGDSITEATAKLGNKEVLYGYPAIASQILGGKQYNCGVGGSGYVKTGNLNQDNMVNRYDSYINVINPDYLITAGGLNDGMVEGIEDAIDSYWSHVKDTLTSGRAIVCSAYNPATSVPDNLEKQGEILRKTALKYEFPYIDMLHGKVYDALGNLLSTNINGGVVTDDNRKSLYDDYYAGTSNDNTHPSAQGNIYLGKWMAQAIMIIVENDKGFLEVGTKLSD